MAYTEEQKDLILQNIFTSIEDGNSLRKSLIENKIPAITFYEWIDSDNYKAKRYARACEMRAESLVDEIMDIADTQNADVYLDDNGNTQVDGSAIQRSKLQVDTRKWLVGKLNPKKYGDKLETTLKGDPENPVQQKITVEVKNSGASIANSESDVDTNREI